MKKYIIALSCIIILNGCFTPPVRTSATSLPEKTRSTMALCSNGLKTEDVIKIDAEYRKNKGTVRTGTENTIEGKIVIDGEDRTEFYKAYVNCIKNVNSQTTLDKEKKTKKENIYKIEKKEVLNDKRLSEYLHTYYQDLAKFYTEQGQESVSKKNPETIKDQCKKAIGLKKEKSHSWHEYFNILNYRFEKIEYRDNQSVNIINSCKRLVNTYPLEPEYLYYLSIGYHMSIDYSNAIKFLKLSAKEGSIDAQRKLGIIYLTGSITQKDEKLGKALLLKSASNGDSASKKILDFLKK